MFALIEDGAVAKYPYSLRELQLANPNTSFAQNDDATYEAFGMFRVFNSTPPSLDETTERLVEGTPVFDVEANRWAQVWQIVALTQEEIQQRYDAQVAQVRAERNGKLAASDWTQVIDAPVDQAAWAAYRQALRDISNQEGFPWSVNWPVQPA